MKIFISHKQVDSAAIAEKLFYSLEKQGHTPWLDVNMPDRSVVGMEKGVKEANFCIAIISENYFSAKFCLSELQWAQEYGVPVVPVLNMDDKKRVSEFMNICPGDFKWVGGINMETLDRTDLDYWKLGLSKVLKAAGSAAPPPKITKVEAQKVITKMVDEGKITSFCPNGHTMKALGKSRDNGWACDGRKLKDKCLKGCTDFHQTKGWNRWQCQQDDFDFCEGCANHYEPSDLNKSYFCPNGHTLEALGNSRDNGWACDGRKLKNGCVRGCTDFKQTKGWNRWQCKQDDFDFCEGCADHYKAADKAMAALNIGKSKVCRCPKGHTLKALATSRDNGWACDGRKYADGCLSGCTDFKQTKGWNRWRCEQDDFDFCAKCRLYYEGS